MRTKTRMLLLTGVAVAACAKMTADPIVTSPIQGVIASDDHSTDPYACAVVEVPPGASEIDGAPVVRFVGGFGGAGGNGGTGYAGICKQTRQMCWYTGDLSPDCAPNCGGWSVDGNVVHGGQHMVCEYICETDADCPAPATGTAPATCLQAIHACAVSCANGETCPDGFICIQPGLGIGTADGGVMYVPKQCVQYKRIDGPLPM